MILPDANLPWPPQLRWEHVVALSGDEGCRLVSYRNFPGEPWTNGWGETDGVGPNMVWTQEYADQRFCDSMTERVTAVLSVCTRPPTPNQLGAMVRLVYNIGMGWAGAKKPAGAKDGFRQSTVLRQHNAGNFLDAARAFELWDKVSDGKGGLVENAGLLKRRKLEGAMYLEPEPGTDAQPMPQAVDAESKLSTSPIVRAAGAAGGISLTQLAIDIGEKIDAVKPAIAAGKDVIANVIGIPPSWVAPVIVIALVAVIVYWRVQQRNTGRA